MLGHKEALELVEYYKWPVVWNDSGCIIVTKGGATEPQASLLLAIRDAMRLQVKWSLNNK